MIMMLAQEEEESSLHFLGKCSENSVRTTMLNDYSDLGNLQWSSAKTCNRLC